MFWAKLQANRARRAVKNLGSPVAKCALGEPAGFPVVLAESRTPLWSEADPRERRLQLGKVQNLRLVAKGIDRAVLAQWATFSFWAQVGRPGGSKGYMPGRQIQEGCVIPAIAGGICQLSNALHDVALKAGFEVTERHAHTRSLPSGSWSAGRDATVAWNHVDLRFRAPVDAMVRVRLTTEELVVQLLGRESRVVTETRVSGVKQGEIESCETCGMVQCWRHKTVNHGAVGAKTSWIVDQAWPEYARYVRERRGAEDSLLLALDGARRNVARYAWPTEGFSQTVEAKLVALRRSFVSRKLSEQGAERQRANLEFDAHLAQFFARRLRFDSGHVVVSQTLLPHLWNEGALGGRTFDVLMVRRPMHELQSALDAEHARHPERALLADFRAPASLVEAEREALAAATKIVTPHPYVASLFGQRAELLEWELPKPKGFNPGYRIAFPGPTISRKGAHELREVARELRLKLTLCGSELEGPDFWEGVDVVRASGDWLDGCCAVVQPAVLEDQPRRLLRAVAEGVPVIATAACGVSQLPGVTTVPVGDAVALRQAVRQVVLSP